VAKTINKSLHADHYAACELIVMKSTIQRGNNMKVRILVFSQTGNTLKVGASISKGLEVFGVEVEDDNGAGSYISLVPAAGLLNPSLC